VNDLKKWTTIVLCFGISLTERFTQASIPLIVNHMGFGSIELSLFFSAMAASTVFTGLAVAPYVDACNQKKYRGLICSFAVFAGLSLFMFRLSEALVWGCFLIFCIGTLLRIINLRRLSVINSEVNAENLSRTHTSMQLSITIAMAAAPIFLALTPPDNYFNLAVVLMLACAFTSLCTSSVSSTARTSTLGIGEWKKPKELASANRFIFVGMLLSGIFLSTLLTYCQSVSDLPVEMYTHIIFSQVVGLIAANVIFERFFGEQFNGYSFLIITIALSELGFILTKSYLLINALSCLIGFSFQIMFLRSHNQFQRIIPHGLTTKFNGARGLYTVMGTTAGYIFGPILHKIGSIELVFMTCSIIALFFFLFLKHLKPTN
jgi:hypothetical protein